MQIRTIVAAASFGVLVAENVADAFCPPVGKRTGAEHHYIAHDSLATLATVPGATFEWAVNHVRRGAYTWQERGRRRLHWVFDGTTSVLPDPLDGTNTVSHLPVGICGIGELSCTTVTLDGAEIKDTDIYFVRILGAAIPWTYHDNTFTPPPLGGNDIYAHAVHNFGHAMGLADTFACPAPPVPSVLTPPAAGQTAGRYLKIDDLLALETVTLDPATIEYLLESVDGGVSWTKADVPAMKPRNAVQATNSLNGLDPSLDAAIWLDGDTRSLLVSKRLDGAPWEAPLQLDVDPDDKTYWDVSVAVKPGMDVQSRNMFAALWMGQDTVSDDDREVVFSASLDGGNTWTPPNFTGVGLCWDRPGIRAGYDPIDDRVYYVHQGCDIDRLGIITARFNPITPGFELSTLAWQDFAMKGQNTADLACRPTFADPLIEPFNCLMTWSDAGAMAENNALMTLSVKSALVPPCAPLCTGGISGTFLVTQDIWLFDTPSIIFTQADDKDPWRMALSDGNRNVFIYKRGEFSTDPWEYVATVTFFKRIYHPSLSTTTFDKGGGIVDTKLNLHVVVDAGD